ncbi:MAG: hypothetical protein CM15mP71_0330 [Candidatus Poseidoniales archaeon]|nr:MAG: hypothetical protein CM15mP71_0330 [Candidatus Poseidoniales archaeon]
MRWYAYNGDADGICSMVQWGLAYGIEGHRVTGVKRDIELLERVNPNPMTKLSLWTFHWRETTLSHRIVNSRI